VAFPCITFLSDYGLTDDFVGVCHGVIARICPDARVIDLTHGVARGDVRGGALVLRGALAYLPVGVHIAVVDPGVGGERRAVAVRLADGRVLVGPDNGLLSLCFAVARGVVEAVEGVVEGVGGVVEGVVEGVEGVVEGVGGVVEAVDIGGSPFALQPVSATFHGRDIFAPVAARIAAGAALSEAGDAIDPSGLVALSLPRARFEDGVLVAHAIYVDGFGNVQLDVQGAEAGRLGLELGQEVALEVFGGDRLTARYERTFGDAAAGELLLYEDAYRRLALAVNQGSAGARLGVAVDDELRVSWG
jgi:S-adenosyl-L-methionine hydrolase (adenosine-forming)